MLGARPSQPTHCSPDRGLRDQLADPAEHRASKYAVGVAALHPALPPNPWHQTLRRYFTPPQLQVGA